MASDTQSQSQNPHSSFPPVTATAEQAPGDSNRDNHANTSPPITTSTCIKDAVINLDTYYIDNVPKLQNAWADIVRLRRQEALNEGLNSSTPPPLAFAPWALNSVPRRSLLAAIDAEFSSTIGNIGPQRQWEVNGLAHALHLNDARLLYLFFDAQLITSSYFYRWALKWRAENHNADFVNTIYPASIANSLDRLRKKKVQLSEEDARYPVFATHNSPFKFKPSDIISAAKKRQQTIEQTESAQESIRLPNPANLNRESDQKPIQQHNIDADETVENEISDFSSVFDTPWLGSTEIDTDADADADESYLGSPISSTPKHNSIQPSPVNGVPVCSAAVNTGNKPEPPVTYNESLLLTKPQPQPQPRSTSTPLDAGAFPMRMRTASSNERLRQTPALDGYFEERDAKRLRSLSFHSDEETRLTNTGVKGWLNGDMINKYLQILMAHSEDYCSFETLEPPSPSPSATDRPSAPLPLATRIVKSIRTRPYTVIAINLNLDHFVCVRLDHQQRRASIYDSLSGCYDLRTITGFIEYNVNRVMGHDGWATQGWKSEMVKCPQQSNNYDCGIYTLVFAARLILNQEIMDPIDDAFIYRRWIQSLCFRTQLLQPEELVVESRFDAPLPPDELLSVFTDTDTDTDGGNNTQRRDISHVLLLGQYFASFRSQAQISLTLKKVKTETLLQSVRSLEKTIRGLRELRDPLIPQMRERIQNLTKDQDHRTTALTSLKEIRDNKCEVIPSLKHEWANFHDTIRTIQTRLQALCQIQLASRPISHDVVSLERTVEGYNDKLKSLDIVGVFEEEVQRAEGVST